MRIKFMSVKLTKEQGLYPWQEALLAEVSNFDFRKIDIVIDMQGNNGKSMLDDWIYYHRLGQFEPSSLGAHGIRRSNWIKCVSQLPVENRNSLA